MTDELAEYMDGEEAGGGAVYDSEVYEVNNYGPNDNLLVRRDRARDVPESELKTILMWNDAYGVRTYDIGHGREPFYRYSFIAYTHSTGMKIMILHSRQPIL